jgi:hypothetical protein
VAIWRAICRIIIPKDKSGSKDVEMYFESFAEIMQARGSGGKLLKNDPDHCMKFSNYIKDIYVNLVWTPKYSSGQLDFLMDAKVGLMLAPGHRRSTDQTASWITANTAYALNSDNMAKMLKLRDKEILSKIYIVIER